MCICEEVLSSRVPKSLDITIRVVGNLRRQGHLSVVSTYNNMGEVYRNQDLYEKALELLPERS